MLYIDERKCTHMKIYTFMIIKKQREEIKAVINFEKRYTY